MKYLNSDKRKLYWLIDQLLDRKIDPETFCDEFYYCYDLELEHKLLSETENRIFAELDDVSSRFSSFEQDLKLDAKAFVDEQQLRSAVLHAKNCLNQL